MDEIFLGLMSGTSMDGVDALAASFNSLGHPHFLGQIHHPYGSALRAELNALCRSGSNEIERSQKAAQELGCIYAQAIKELLKTLDLTPSQITAAGVHGQTVRHCPQQGWSLQLNAPAVIAERTGINVIADFRARDLAAGGEGAPLVPAFHAAIFAGAQPRAIVNIGGIANVSLLKGPNAVPVGFDCGPGNTLLDAWCEKHTGAPFDQDGRWAQTGQVQPELLARLLAEPYFSRPAPKSTGRELFNLEWLCGHLQAEKPADVEATLVELTARGITDAITQYLPQTKEIYVCGGGAFNNTLLAALQRALPQAAVATTAALGVPPMQVEGLAFAWLSWAFWHRVPGNVPQVTHAAGPRILGALYPA